MTARRRGPVVPRSELVAALLSVDDVYELGLLVPEKAECGRPRMFPGFMYVLYGALLSVFTSSRKVEAELGCESTWHYICSQVQRRFPRDPSMIPRDPSMWLDPNQRMRRHHYGYMRNRYLVDQKVLERLLARFRTAAATHAKELGMCNPDGAGSLTHPCLDRMLYADGKVVTPLYKAKPGTKRVDHSTGEILGERRSDPDAHLHITGSGEMAYGNKFVLLNCRLPAPHARVILDVSSVPDIGGEAAVAVTSLRDVAPLLPGAQGILYDGAFRGVHMQVVLNELGVLPVVPVTAKAGGRRKRKPREEHVIPIEARVVATPKGAETVQFLARAGAIGVGELDETGEVVFRRLERVSVKRRQNRTGGYRFYVEYRLPPEMGGGLVRLRIDTTTDDAARKLNRSEYVRGIPVDDPDYERLYPRRSDAESINRALDDTLWLRRAHPKGRLRQLFELMGFALMTNALAVFRHGTGALSRAG